MTTEERLDQLEKLATDQAKEITKLRRDANRLLQHNRDLLNTNAKLAYQAINELEQRPYTDRRTVACRAIGVRVLSETKLANLSTQNRYRLARRNAERLAQALCEGGSLSLPKGVLVIDRQVTAEAAAVDIKGAGYESIIRMLAPQAGSAEAAAALLLDVSDNPDQVFVENIVFESDSPLTACVALKVKGFPVQPTPERIYSKPLGHIKNVHVRGTDTYNAAPPWYNGFFGGIEVDSPNIITVEGCMVQGNGFRYADGSLKHPDSWGSFGYRFNAPRASIENILRGCEAYDVATGLIGETLLSAPGNIKPGLEGLRVDGCTFAGVRKGVVLINEIYGGPGFWIGNGTHIAASETGVLARNIRQGWIDKCLIYVRGNNDGKKHYASFIEFVECSDWRITGNSCYYFHPEGVSPAWNDAYGFLIQGVVTNEYYNPAVANYIGGGNLLVNTRPENTKPAIWLQGYYANNNQVPENENWHVGFGELIRQNNPYNFVGKHLASDKTDGYTPAHNLSLSRDIIGEYENEFGQTVTGVIGRTLEPSGASLNRDPADGAWVLDLEGARTDFIFIAAAQIAERGPGDSGTDTQYIDFTLKRITMRYGRHVCLLSDRPWKLRHDPDVLYLQGERNAVIEPFEPIWLTYRADDSRDRTEEVGRGGGMTGRLVTTGDDLAAGHYTLSANIWPLLANTNEQVWHLLVQTKTLGGTTYECQQAQNLFKPVSIFRVKKGDGWSPWVRQDNAVVTITDPDTDLPAGQYYLDAALYPGCGSWYLYEYRVSETNTSYRAQLAIGLAGQYMITRRKEAGSWTPWKRTGQVNASGPTAITAGEFAVGFDPQGNPQIWIKGEDGATKLFTQVNDYVPSGLRNPIDFELMAYNYYLSRPQRIGINDLVNVMLHSAGSGMLSELDGRYATSNLEALAGALTAYLDNRYFRRDNITDVASFTAATDKAVRYRTTTGQIIRQT